MIAAPVKTKGGGGALLPAVVGICDALRCDNAEAAAETDPGEMLLYHAAGPRVGDGAAVLEDLPGLRADLRACAAGRGIALNA